LFYVFLFFFKLLFPEEFKSIFFVFSQFKNGMYGMISRKIEQKFLLKGRIKAKNHVVQQFSIYYLMQDIILSNIYIICI